MLLYSYKGGDYMTNPEQYYLDAFRTNLKNFRTEKGITLKELAEKIGVTEATVQRYECGKGIKRVSYDRICAIAEALGCEPDALTGMKKEPAYQEGFEFGRLAKKYRQLTDEEKLSVDKYIDFLLSSRK